MKVESVPQAAGRVFISYRREETAYAAGWLFDRLSERFPRGEIFKDVDSIQLGDDFVEVINAAVGSCDVLLALIGDQWLTVTDRQGNARLDDPDDYVRLEIEAALTRDVRVIPILVGRAGMPRAEELPASLARLVRRNALELSPSRFESDTGRLLKVLERTLADVHAQPAVVEPGVAVATRQARLRALYVEARAEMRLGHFQTAIDLLTDLLALDPNHRDAAQLRDAATQQLYLAETYQRAADSEAASEWAEAVTAYSEILEADPAYLDAAGRREVCEARQQVSDLQGELRHHAAAAHWQAVLDVNAELASIDPAAADPDGLATQAQQVLDEEQTQREAEEAARQAEKLAQHDAEETARRQAAEKAEHEAQAAARRQAAEQAQHKAEAARRQAAEQARHDAEEAARRQAEEQARHDAEEAARRQAEEQARHDAEEAARRQAAERAQHKAQEAARRRAEEKAQHKAEEKAYNDAWEAWEAARRRRGRRWAAGGLIGAALVAAAVVASVVIFGLRIHYGARAGRFLTEGQMRPGDCLTDSNMPLGTSGPWPTRVHSVSCEQSHIAEVYYASKDWVADDAYPGETATRAKARSRCATAFRSYVRIPQSQSNLHVKVLYPSAETWRSGDRLVVCIAYGANLSATIKHPPRYE